jgi:hypothetical protein
MPIAFRPRAQTVEQEADISSARLSGPPDIERTIGMAFPPLSAL